MMGTAVTTCLLLLSVCALGYHAQEIVVPMPTKPGAKHNDYMCAGVNVERDSYILSYDPRPDPRVVHHMLMFGCPGRVGSNSWSCKGNYEICSGGGRTVYIYAWALNASGLELPPDVGMQIGPAVQVNSMVVQIHYGHPETVPPDEEVSKQAVVLQTSTLKPAYVAGIYILGTATPLAPGEEQVFSDSTCKFLGPKTIHPFAFRTHAHSLGSQIVGYIVKPDNEWQMIGTRSPQDAQTFYPATSDSLEVEIGDYLAARCVFNTKDKTRTVNMGPDSEDEMCNFYMMYYTVNDGQSLFSNECWSVPPRWLTFPPTLPPLPHLLTSEAHHHHGMGGNDKDEDDDDHEDHEDHGDQKDHEDQGGSDEGDYKCPVPVPPGDPSKCPTTSPPTEFIEGLARPLDHALGLVEAEDWVLNEVSIPENTLGQVSAVAIAPDGKVHILHRGSVHWDQWSFDFYNRYLKVDKGPIPEPTMLQFDSTGSPELAWGEDLFYMPHGLTIDKQGSFWVTDAALHQVFKFSAGGDTKPALTLGVAFTPGSASDHFCKPTSVAVEDSGDFYVSDGYCNSRILKFDSSGRWLETWDTPVASLGLLVPHKISLSHDQSVLFVADRENKRVVTFDTRTGEGRLLSAGLPSAVYALYTNGGEWPLFGVFGGAEGTQGFTMDSSGTVVSTWGPKQGFSKAHDLTVDSIQGAVYVTEIGPNRIWKFVNLNIVKEIPVVKATDKPHSIPTEPLNSTQSHDNSVHDETQSHDHHVTKIPQAHNTTEEIADKGDPVDAESAHPDSPDDLSRQRATFNIGIFIAIFVVVLIILLVVFGILREHRYLQKLKLYIGRNRKSTAGGKGGGVNIQTRGRKGKPLNSLLGPSRPGFSRLKTYDSDSEDEEFPVFNRV